jgi:predicted RNA-binding Zn ribbon-like protein
MPDVRPLTGEPLALDLLNTEWIGEGERQDLLRDEAGLRAWLGSISAEDPANERTLAALIEARAAIRGVLERPDDPNARGALNLVLARGRVVLRLGDGGPEIVTEVAPEQSLAWRAARNLLELWEGSRERIKSCAHPDCILHFLDTSKSKTRRWCSMTGCGNRAKAKRHYERSRPPR